MERSAGFDRSHGPGHRLEGRSAPLLRYRLRRAEHHVLAAGQRPHADPPPAPNGGYSRSQPDRTRLLRVIRFRADLLLPAEQERIRTAGGTRHIYAPINRFCASSPMGSRRADVALPWLPVNAEAWCRQDLQCPLRAGLTRVNALSVGVV